MDSQNFYKSIQNAYHIENENTVKKLPFSCIIKVTSKKLVYENSDGIIEEIDLNSCVKNFCEESGNELKNQAGDTVMAVGGRCFCMPIAFYEFFTDEHHTRFCMTLKQTPIKRFLIRLGWNVYSNDFSRFYSLQKELNSFGYSAIDLT